MLLNKQIRLTCKFYFVIKLSIYGANLIPFCFSELKPEYANIEDSSSKQIAPELLQAVQAFKPNVFNSFNQKFGKCLIRNFSLARDGTRFL